MQCFHATADESSTFAELRNEKIDNPNPEGATRLLFYCLKKSKRTKGNAKMTNENTKLSMPEPLDTSKFYTREERRQHAAAVASYHETVRAEEQRQPLAEEAARAEANRVMTQEEYEALALLRYQEKVAKEAEQAAAEKAQAEAKEAYLASMPDIAEIEARSEFIFLSDVAHWFAKGYTADEKSIIGWIPGFYCVKLNKPAPAKIAK
jgi:hypothetical protein